MQNNSRIYYCVWP